MSDLSFLYFTISIKRLTMIKRIIITIYLSCGFLLSITPQAVHTLPILKTNPINFYKPKVLEVFNAEVKAVVDLTVKKNGKVADVEIVEYPYDKYDQSLLKSLSNIEFIPAKVNSKPLSVRYRMPIIFKRVKFINK